MHNPQHPQLLRALHTITQLAPLLDQALIPTQGGPQNTYTPPKTPGPTAPLNTHALYIKEQIENTLRPLCAQLRKDTQGLHGKPTPTLAGMAGWLHHQSHHLEAATWIDSETWWQHITRMEGTTATQQTIGWANTLEYVFNPPIKNPPARTATELHIILGIKPTTLRQWCARGKLKPIGKQGKKHLYSVDEVKKLISQQ